MTKTVTAFLHKERGPRRSNSHSSFNTRTFPPSEKRSNVPWGRSRDNHFPPFLEGSDVLLPESAVKWTGRDVRPTTVESRVNERRVQWHLLTRVRGGFPSWPFTVRTVEGGYPRLSLLSPSNTKMSSGPEPRSSQVKEDRWKVLRE